MSLTECLQRPKRGASGKEKLTDITALREMVNNSFVQPKQSDDGSANLDISFLDVSGRLEDSAARLTEMVDLLPGDEAGLVAAAQMKIFG